MFARRRSGCTPPCRCAFFGVRGDASVCFFVTLLALVVATGCRSSVRHGGGDGASPTLAEIAANAQPEASGAAVEAALAPPVRLTFEVERHPRPGFRKTLLSPEDLSSIFRTIPEIASIGTEIRYFTEGDAKNIVARSGAAHDDIVFATSPIVWSPETGAELLVATGRGKSSSFVVALWLQPEGRYRFASAFVMQNDLSPVTLAYDPFRRQELKWSTCWGCAGEQGNVSYRFDDKRVVIVQE